TYPNLLVPVGAQIAEGTWFAGAGAQLPEVVLGSAAAQRLGVVRVGPDVQVWLGDRWFTVVGRLAPVPLAPELDAAAVVGWPAAQQYLGFDGHPTRIYCRIDEDHVEAVARVLPATANPRALIEVTVSRPSDALAAKRASERTFSALLVGLGAVALVV